MTLSYFFYRYFTTCLYFLLFPAYVLYKKISNRSYEDIDQRLGNYNQKIANKGKTTTRLWIHAASVGEVSAAAGIIEELYKSIPDCEIIFSTTTRHGLSFARKSIGRKFLCLTYAPLDFIVSVRKAIRFFKPDILVCIETEIWPNWLAEAHRMGVKTAIVNGRISTRSMNRYIKIRPLFKKILNQVDTFSMIRPEDARRIKLLGASWKRIQINGNSKYDLLIKQAIPDLEKKFKDFLDRENWKTVFVAGSTRNQEEQIILDAYLAICRDFPDTKLIIAPRHVERTPHIQKLIHKKGLGCVLRTEITETSEPANILLMDTIGELMTVYSIATVVFCGGSLVPLGGHNILEAAVWGKPVLYGPFMDDFLDARDLLEKTGGGIAVMSGRELTEKILDILMNPEKAKRLGDAAREAVFSHKGAAERHAAAIRKTLNL
jgi:3-deoxy-D-manno-octulosonic-acid transferase